MSEYKNVETMNDAKSGYYMKCCDCGLVHKLNFRVIKDKIGRVKIQFQAFRVTRKRSKK